LPRIDSPSPESHVRHGAWHAILTQYMQTETILTEYVQTEETAVGLTDSWARRAAVVIGCILAFTAGAVALLLFVPELAASGLLAYTFGLRHAVDADHIAAIDNVTRRLTTGQRRPVSVGFFFALGHSSVVLIMCIGVACASGYMHRHLQSFAQTGGVIGAAISGSFLLAVGAMNIYTTVQLLQSWREQSRYGGHTHALAGFCMSCCPMLFEGIKAPWQMYPIGFLFGLGFDTSSEIGLLGIVAMSNGLQHPVCILVLPLLFMAGMCLIDTLNGLLMAWAYGKALEDNMQKLYYNIFLTATSGLIAVLVGAVELLGVLANEGGLHGWFWDRIAKINENFETVGLIVIAIFLTSLLVALGCFRKVFPANQVREEPIRQDLLRYLERGDFIDRSGI